MTVGYKHVHAKFADNFASGASIRIGTLSHYRASESFRGDHLEGLAINSVSYAGANSDDAAIDRLMRAKFSNSREFIQNNYFSNIGMVQEAANGYIFCVSTTPDWKSIEKGETCFKISNLECFAKLLSRVLPDYCSPPVVNSVIYENRSVDMAFSEPAVTDPFRKNKNFQWENEIRIYWRLQNMDKVPDFLDLKCPQLSHLIGIVD